MLVVLDEPALQNKQEAVKKERYCLYRRRTSQLISSWSTRSVYTSTKKTSLFPDTLQKNIEALFRLATLPLKIKKAHTAKTVYIVKITIFFMVTLPNLGIVMLELKQRKYNSRRACAARVTVVGLCV